MNHQAEQITDREEAIKVLRDKIKDIHIAMLTTIQPDGTLRSRPMGTQQAEFDGDLWFFTAADAPKVEEVEQAHNVSISYARPESNTYISISGRAYLVRDKARAKELWNPMLKAWFPKGLDDPELALLRVEVEQAEYWDTPSGKVVAMLGIAKAAITGQTAKVGEDKKINLG